MLLSNSAQRLWLEKVRRFRNQSNIVQKLVACAAAIFGKCSNIDLRDYIQPTVFNMQVATMSFHALF